MNCFLMVVAYDSSIDVATNNLSMFSAVEEIALTALPMTVPFHFVTAFEAAPNEIGERFELRFVIADGARRMEGRVQEFTMQKPRMRIRGIGFDITAAGSFDVRVEWRRANTNEWQSSPTGWPLKIQLGPPPAT